MQLENLEKEKIDSLEETQMDLKTLNKKKNKEKKKKKEKAADEVAEEGNKKIFESEKTKKKRETEESLEKSADGVHKKKDKGRKMESLSSEVNGNGSNKRKGVVADGDGGTDTKKRKKNGQKDGETTDSVKPSSEKAADEVVEDVNKKSFESEKKKKKRETEESLEKSADGVHKKKDKGRKMESLSSEANSNGGRKRKGAVADGDGRTDTKKRKNGEKDGETTDSEKPSSEKAADEFVGDSNKKSFESEKTKKREKEESPEKSADGVETEESLEKSAGGVHKKKDKGRKMESLSSEANGNGSKKGKGVVADGDGGTDTKKRKKNEQKDRETTDSVTHSSLKAKNAKDMGAEKGKEAKKSKKVRFAGDEVLGDKLVRGKRFSEEEDQLIRDAVYKYIDRNQLGREEGLEMVLKCSKHSKKVKGCWKQIGAAIPYRPYISVYYRAHTIFERSEKRGFSEEENEIIKKFHADHGADWKGLSEVLGKQRIHVKDAWRRIRLPNRKRGRWSQDEYQSLFDLVNLNLRMKAFEEKKPDIPIVKGKSDSTKRENISWEAISDKLSTRTMSCCCHKWYDQLTSSLVHDGVWADTDDYLLLDALQKQDGCNVEDVDWDSLIDGRSGEVCQRRWGEMLRHLGGHRERTFIEQLVVLTKRYCGDMLQYRFRQDEDEDDDDQDEEEKDE